MKNRVLSFLLAAILTFSLCVVAVPQAQATSTLKTSEEGIQLIKDFEGFNPTAYEDYGHYSIGYGTACGADTYPHGITMSEANRLLRIDVAKIETYLDKFISKNNLTLSQQQYDALVSFTYNLGSSWMDNPSTFRSAILEGAVGNDLIFAITMWCNAGGSVVPGLVQRRMAEANLYLNGVYSKTVPSSYRCVYYNNNMDSATSTVKLQGYDSNQKDAPRAIPSKEGYRFLGWYTDPNGGEWVTVLDANTQNTIYGHWQPVENPDPNGVAARYTRYACEGQIVYDNPGGTQVKTLTAGTSMIIEGDYMDADGVKWGRMYGGGWVKLNETDGKDDDQDSDGTPVNMKVTVLTNGVNIRKGPGTKYSKVGTANKGQQLQLTHVRQGGNYVWGQFSGGWICLDYTDYELVSRENSGDASKVTATGVIIDTDKLNIRSYPSTSGTKVGEYSKGDKVEITLQQQNGNTTWGKTAKGWISLRYVKLTPVTDDTTTPPSSTDPDDSTGTGGSTGTGNSGSNDTQETVIVTGKIVGCDSLRIRSGAGTQHAQVGSVLKNTKVNIYELKTVGSQVWGRIEKGWICMTYVKQDTTGSGNSGSSETVVATGVIFNCTEVNVRVGAGTTYAKVGKLAKGTKIEILQTTKVGNTTWGRTKDGWVSLYYVQLDTTAPDSGSSTPSNPGGSTTTPDAGDENTGNQNQGNQGTNPGQGGNGGSNADQGSTGSTQKVNRIGVITGTSELRVRSEPSANSKEVGKLKKGERVVILDTVKVGSATWARIENGWIHMFYVDLRTETVPEGTIIRTVTTTLRIRAGAGTSYEAIGSYLRGTQVTITAQTTVNGTVWGRTDKGWISLDYVK